MLKTPLGNIEIRLDNNPISYVFYAIKNDKRCPDLEGRYLILVHMPADGKEHTISCTLADHKPHLHDDIESGEWLACIGLYEKQYKLSIAIRGEDVWNHNLKFEIYDCVYLKNGICCHTFSFTNISYYVFGIAWASVDTPASSDEASDRDTQTWLGAEVWS